MPSLTLVTHGAVAALAAALVWGYTNARHAAAIGEIRVAQADAQLATATTARAKQRAITDRYLGALNAARDREALLRVELDQLRDVSDGLRDQAADAGRRLASAPPAAVLEYATAVNAIYDDCRAAYEGMAAKAAGHAADVRTLRDAWPVTP